MVKGKGQRRVVNHMPRYRKVGGLCLAVVTGAEMDDMTNTER
jgi:hypothetical protein